MSGKKIDAVSWARDRLEEYMKLEAVYRVESEAGDDQRKRVRDINVLASMAAVREQMFDEWRKQMYLRVKEEIEDAEAMSCD